MDDPRVKLQSSEFSEQDLRLARLFARMGGNKAVFEATSEYRPAIVAIPAITTTGRAASGGTKMLDPKANRKLSRKSSPSHVHSKAGQTAYKELSRCIRLLTSLFPNGIFTNGPPRLRIELAGCGLSVEDPRAASGEPTGKGEAENQLPQVTLREEDLARSTDEILTILLHQMVHVADYERGVEDLYPGGFHNLQFRMSAQEVGFLVTQSEPRCGTDQFSPGAELLSLFRDIRMAPSVLKPFRHEIPAPDRPWTCHWGPPPMARSVPIQQMRIHLPDAAPAPPWPVIQKKTGKVHFLWQNQELRPRLRLTGKWLRQIGFDVGARIEIKTAPGYIFLRVLGS